MTNIGFRFGTVYAREATARDVRRALEELMGESDHLPTDERGLEPTPDDVTSEKTIRSFALLPIEEGWTAVLEDGHPLDDGGVAEGLSDILGGETIHFAYSDPEGFWEFTRYLEGQPLEAGGADDEDYDVSALDFIEAQALPHFGVCYEEVAAASGDGPPALAGSLAIEGDIVPRIPIGTEIVTFKRVRKPRPAAPIAPEM